MFPILQIGPAAVQTPGLILILSLWIGLTVAEKLAHRFNTQPNDLYNIIFNALIFGVIGARFTYVLQYSEIFLEAPLNIFSLNPGLLDPVSGVAFGILAAIIYGNRKKLPLWSTLDALVPLFGVLVIGISLSNLASGNGFGSETNLPWGLHLWGVKRHPSQIYESLMGVIILWIVWPKKRKTLFNKNLAGEKFLIFLALSAGARIFLEAFRGDSIILINNIRTLQVISWFVLAGSLWALQNLKNKKEE